MAPGGDGGAGGGADEAEQLRSALHELLSASPELAEAGPKAVLDTLKKKGEAWASVSVPKCKRALQQVKSDLAEQAERRKKRLASAHDCPLGCGLARFVTHHDSFCCDVCRVYQKAGSGMWGCRKCDWDVCEARCRPKESQSLVDLDATLRSLQQRSEEAKARDPAEAKSGLAQVEAEVHQLEKALDSKDLAKLAELEKEAGRGPTTDEALRAERKRLLKATEEFLEKLEASFAELDSKTAADAGGAEASKVLGACHPCKNQAEEAKA